MMGRMRILTALAVGCAFGSAATGCAFAFMATAKADGGGQVMTAACTDKIQLGVTLNPNSTVTPNFRAVARFDVPGRTWQDLYSGAVTVLPVLPAPDLATNPQGIKAAAAGSSQGAFLLDDGVVYVVCDKADGHSVSIFVR